MTPSRWLDEEGQADPALGALRRALDEEPRHVPSEARRRRVWAALRGQRPVRSTRMWAGVAVAAGLTALAAVWWIRLAAPLPIAEVAPRPWPTFELLTTGRGPLTRVLAGGAEVQLLPGTAVAVERDRAPLIRTGHARFRVPHQPRGRRFAVRAGDVEVRVVGTRFEVGVDEGRVSVAVSEGVVEVWTPAAGAAEPHLAARLGAGERWTDAAAPPEHPALPPEDPAPPPAHPAPPPRPAPARPLPEVALTAARAARDADPQRALALYRRLAAGTGPVAENALYEMGEIYRDRLQRPREGLAAWQQYRTRFPRGLLRAEVAVSVMETLAMMGESGPALAEAGGFLRQYPASERHQEVARVAGDLARAGGDCRAAVRYYEQAVQGPRSGRDADDAAFARAACLDELHDRGAAAAATDYLARFPAGRHVSAARAVLEDARRR